MGDVAKEDPAPCKKPLFLYKAGWVKKDTGRLLSSYKDCYIHVEKTEVVIYENEDLKKCLERLNLENYDRCHEIKSALRKKHRLILIRSPKAEKVHDVRFQTQTAEEKEAWIRALCNGISRAKNKIFDEVKIDESCNLEHVTRSRPKGNRNRRPPTRIHLKEVAGMSNDDILHLDLGPENTPMSNGTQYETSGIETSNELPYSISKETKEKEFRTSTDALDTEPVVCTQKKVLKPPMPPTKETKPTTHEVEPEKESCPTKKALNVPMPPPKEAKPCIAVEEATEKTKIERMPIDCDDSGENTSPQTSHSSQVRANGLSENPQPPIPPSKQTKPSNANKVSDQVDFGITENVKEAESNVQCEKSKSCATGEDSGELSAEVGHGMSMSAGDLSTKRPGPLVPPKKKAQKPEKAGTQHDSDKPSEKPDPAPLIPNDTNLSDGVCQTEESLPTNEIPSLLVSVSPLDDGLSASICGLDEGNKTIAEEKSVDSGQHSDDDSDGSRSGDTLAVSTSAMRGSHAGLDAMDSSEEDIHSLCYSGVFSGTHASTSKSALETEVDPCRSSDSDLRGQTLARAKSASFGDLLSERAVCFEARWRAGAVAGKDGPYCHDVRKFEAELFLEMEKTKELLHRASQPQRGADGGDDGDDIAESLLAKAVEKLKKAEYVLREAKKLKSAKTSTNRKSW